MPIRFTTRTCGSGSFGLMVDGRVVRRCWVNFQCRGVFLIWIIIGQGPIALVVGAGEGCLDIFSLIYHFSLLSPSLWETARYRLKYCLKGPLSPKQPSNQPIFWPLIFSYYFIIIISFSFLLLNISGLYDPSTS